MNTFKTFGLMLAMTMILVLLGSAIGGRNGMVVALVIAGGMNFFSYWFSDKIVLKMYGAKEVTEAEAPELYGMVRRLAQKAELPMPKANMLASPRLFLMRSKVSSSTST